jgi:anti-sigma factor RsiW
MHFDDDEALISGYLDNELDAETLARVEARLKADPGFREEFERMKGLITAANEGDMPLPEDAAWDEFLDGVYNRIERRTGWMVLIMGLAALAVYGVVMFFAVPGNPLMKLAVSVPVVGLVLLFISVLRQRLHVAKTDRYSREVQR